MKKIMILAGALLISVFSFANRNESIESILKNHYKNEGLSLNVTEVNADTEISNEENTKSAIRDQIIEFASKKLGAPYVWGATGPNSFDCSGFVGYVFKSVAGLKLPRVSSAQATFKPKISSMNMKKGDLVFFETTGKGRISHVGIYMGNRQFIHAASGKTKRVTVSSLDSTYYNKAFRWAINPFS